MEPIDYPITLGPNEDEMGTLLAFMAGMIGAGCIALVFARNPDGTTGNPYALWPTAAISVSVCVMAARRAWQRWRRVKGFRMEVSNAGINVTENEEARFSIPWHQFGGYRLVKTRSGSATELLGRQGEVLGVVPMNLLRRSGRDDTVLARRAVRMLLDSRSVTGDAVRTSARRHAHPAFASLICLGGIVAILFCFLQMLHLSEVYRLNLDDGDPRWSSLRAGTMAWYGIGLFLGAGLSLAGGFDLYRRRKKSSIIPDELDQGMLLPDLLYEAASRPLEHLSSGQRYSTRPKASGSTYSETWFMLRFFGWMLTGTSLVAWPIFQLLPADRQFPAFPLLVTGVGLLLIPVRKYSSASSAPETIVVTDQDLIVIPATGEHLRFPLPRFDDQSAKIRLTNAGYTELLREGRKTYRLNRTRLIPLEPHESVVIEESDHLPPGLHQS